MLKTLGLVALMARTGIPIPAAPGARVDLFDPVLADIGDLQSVTGDLSTFSGHLVVRALCCLIRCFGSAAFLFFHDAVRWCCLRGGLRGCSVVCDLIHSWVFLCSSLSSVWWTMVFVLWCTRLLNKVVVKNVWFVLMNDYQCSAGVQCDGACFNFIGLTILCDLLISFKNRTKAIYIFSVYRVDVGRSRKLC